MPSLLFGPVPHAEAIAFLKDKPVVSRAVFSQLVPEIQARTFAIAGIESVKVLQALRDRIADLPAGADWDDVKADLVDQLSPYFEPSDAEGADLSAAERRAELLLRTHGYQAYAAAQYNCDEQTKDTHPYRVYSTAKDDRVRESHAALDGLILPIDDPFWQTHFPPMWDWGCRCTSYVISQDEHDRISGEDAKKPPEARRVLTADQRDRMNNSGMLVRGPSVNVDVRSPREKGRPAPGGAPGDLRLPLADIKARYEAPVWGAFEAFAKRTVLDESTGHTLMDWMLGAPHPAKAVVVAAAETLLTAAPATVPVATAAQLLAAEPASPVAQALKLWGDDEDPFGEIITATTPAATVWRGTMAQILSSLQPDASGATLYRGWQFASVEERSAVFDALMADGVFTQSRVGMSASYDAAVAKGPKFLSHHGMMWEIRTPRTARRMDGIFHSLGAKYPHEREAIFPGGARLRVVGAPTEETLVQGGQRITYLHYILEEIL